MLDRLGPINLQTKIGNWNAITITIPSGLKNGKNILEKKKNWNVICPIMQLDGRNSHTTDKWFDVGNLSMQGAKSSVKKMLKGYAFKNNRIWRKQVIT